MPKTVLICDSSAMMRQAIANSLVVDDWVVSSQACTARHALEEYRRTRPTAVTIDIAMSRRDGMTGVREILKYHADAKIVVVSAASEQGELVTRAMANGAFAYVAKPISRQELRDSLARCLA